MIKGVPDTAFMVAAWRAAESDRADALFRDPFAGRLAGPRGLRLADHLSGYGMGPWQVVTRTVVIDQMLREAVAGGASTVLNLGAGLDARPYRLTWPPSLRWIEVDFPEVLAWKDERLRTAQPTCQVERVQLDLTDDGARGDLLARLAATSPATVVLTEGVVPYLTNDTVGALADDLRRLPGVKWIVDYVSPGSIRFGKRLRLARQMRAAPFRFEPADWFGFFQTHGWRAADIKYLPIEGRRLGRPAPLPRVLRLALRVHRWLRPAGALASLRQSTGYVVLEPLPTPAAGSGSRR